MDNPSTKSKVVKKCHSRNFAFFFVETHLNQTVCITAINHVTLAIVRFDYACKLIHTKTKN
jgi:hypothetical protein